MAGTVLGLATLGAVVGAVVLAIPLYRGVAIAQSVSGAADASALAAADVAAGIAPGSPCAVAARIAAANSTSLVACGVDGNVVTIEVTRQFLGVSLAASATAGPSVWVSN